MPGSCAVFASADIGGATDHGAAKPQRMREGFQISWSLLEVRHPFARLQTRRMPSSSVLPQEVLRTSWGPRRTAPIPAGIGASCVLGLLGFRRRMGPELPGETTRTTWGSGVGERGQVLHSSSWARHLTCGSGRFRADTGEHHER